MAENTEHPAGSPAPKDQVPSVPEKQVPAVPEEHLDFDQVMSRLLADMSGDSRVWLQTLYDSLPVNEKRSIVANLQALARDLNPSVFYRIVQLALRQYEGVFDRTRRQISIVGPVNVGKSSLFNALLLPHELKAEVSPVPGTTRDIQIADAGLFTVIDTPGGDEAAGEVRKQRALEAARAADSLIVVFDANTGVTQGTRELYDELRRLNKPMTLVLNKIDLIPPRYRTKVVEKAAHNLGLSPADLIPISAAKRLNLEQVIFSLIRLNPGLLAAVSALVPHYRRQIATRYVAGAAISAFVIGSSPLPVADFFPLVAIQVGLVLQLSRVYGQTVTWDKAKEVLLTLGGGFGLREGFRQVLKILPVPVANWLASGLYAAIGTAALGMAAREYWARGGMGTPAQWKDRVGRLRGRLWKQFRSPRLLRRLRGRKRAAAVLEAELEAKIEQADQTQELE